MRPAIKSAMMGDREGRDERRMSGPVQVTDGAMLCEVRFWGEAEWAAMPDGVRPCGSVHKPGVGWVGMVPIAGLN